jgi:hypothetical protein
MTGPFSMRLIRIHAGIALSNAAMHVVIGH